MFLDQKLEILFPVKIRQVSVILSQPAFSGGGYFCIILLLKMIL
jgi:hypothetical protein